ncbi:uncharacterized protein LOC100118726 isoform X2 [Nasonia vitripennis]|uniref:Amino acid transporter n=1 Tax=Nasonia vitripennis TaxID=7425 RepID=A0A7M7QM39_NASVI|nr:uncharacterized protein LOC100118726 isoform X2 [Nasonia vitripennis]XP_032451773.1 uncharacterized protein LOC100118726 isoform X2 [Nasonia vitripennis]
MSLLQRISGAIAVLRGAPLESTSLQRSQIEQTTAEDEAAHEPEKKLPSRAKIAGRAKAMGGLLEIWVRENLLLVLTVLGVLLGCLLGFVGRLGDFSAQSIMLIGFPGEILMRTLKMFILPLIVSSLIAGMAQLDARSSGRIGVRALTYYMATTVLAALVGIAVVLLIHPGDPRIKNIVAQGAGDEAKVSSLDAILDIIRYVCIYKKRTNAQKHGAGEPRAGVLPAGPDDVREEEGRGHRREPEPERLPARAGPRLQGRHQRHGHDRLLHKLRPAGRAHGAPRQAHGRLLRRAQRDRHEVRQPHRHVVLALRNNVHHRRQDHVHLELGRDRPDARALHAHRRAGPPRPRRHHAAPHLLADHAAQPRRLLQGHHAGLDHRRGNRLERGDSADNVPLPRGEQQDRPQGHEVRRLGRGDRQHGRDRAVRGRRCHFHRPDERHQLGRRRGHHRQLDGDAGQHRRGQHPQRRAHHHAPGPDRSGPAHLRRVSALRRRLVP